jgi:16S rRNA (guanine966-N2)-methyltransferase
VRIVAGRWRGRRIDAPAGADVRPTLDRVREAWMSILQADIPGALVVDLFAGSGALGIEALSRGAARVDFVESSSRSLAVLRANLDRLGAGEQATVHRKDALRFATSLSTLSYDIAFADPPYSTSAATRLSEIWLNSRFASILGIEHPSSERLTGGDTRRYGTTAITIYRAEE